MNDTVEALGFALALAFLWFIWAPLVLLGAGILLIVWANTRARSGSLGAAVRAAVRAYAASSEPQSAPELRRVA